MFERLRRPTVLDGFHNRCRSPAIVGSVHCSVSRWRVCSNAPGSSVAARLRARIEHASNPTPRARTSMAFASAKQCTSSSVRSPIGCAYHEFGPIPTFRCSAFRREKGFERSTPARRLCARVVGKSSRGRHVHRRAVLAVSQEHKHQIMPVSGVARANGPSRVSDLAESWSSRAIDRPSQWAEEVARKRRH